MSGKKRRFLERKVVLLGESAVGKTSLVLRYVRNQFEEYQEPTVGVAFLTREVELDDVTNLGFVVSELNSSRFSDTAGQERYAGLAQMVRWVDFPSHPFQYYRGSHAAIIVYDVTSPESFRRAESWIAELQKNGPENCIICLAGNKSDLPQRKVSTALAEDFADDRELFLFMETSAKTGQNVVELFRKVAEGVPKTVASGDDDDADFGVNLEGEDSEDESRCRC